MKRLASLAFAATAVAVSATSALALDKVTFGTNWFAEAEHGGFYQAVVDGTYAKYGLDVTIVQGGPQANNLMLMVAGKIDFYMGGNMIQTLSSVEQKIPIVVVAATFQKDPQIIMSHPGQGLDKFQDLVHSPIYIARKG
jgi:NitT/TauT family transport system substrate-binding protein